MLPTSTSYENPGRLGLIAFCVVRKSAAFTANTSPTHAEQRADLTQVASLLLGFVAGKFSDHAPNLPPKLGKTSQNFWDEIAAVCFG